MLATDTNVITLNGGLSVPLTALQLLWDLEERGFSIATDGDCLIVRPRSRLTADDDRAIREHKSEIMALCRYCENIQ